MPFTNEKIDFFYFQLKCFLFANTELVGSSAHMKELTYRKLRRGREALKTASKERE